MPNNVLSIWFAAEKKQTKILASGSFALMEETDKA